MTTVTEEQIHRLRTDEAYALAVLESITRREERLAKMEAAILDIDAHAAPYGSGEWAEHYVVSAGSLHRALGLVGHTAPKCRECHVCGAQTAVVGKEP